MNLVITNKILHCTGHAREWWEERDADGALVRVHATEAEAKLAVGLVDSLAAAKPLTFTLSRKGI